MTRPNILLIHADQHRADCLGCDGHPFIQTPNLDHLAATGIRCTRAYTPIPLCTPARTSLLTGQWPMQHGVIANHGTEGEGQLASDSATFSQVLHEHGYWLGYIGKWGVDPKRTPNAFGFHDFVPEGRYAEERNARGLPARPNMNRWFGEVDPQITAEQSRLAWGADQVIQRLRQFERRAQPFFLRWDPSEPHLPNVVPEPFASLYPPSSIPPWPNFHDALHGKPYIQRQQRQSWGIEEWNWGEWAPIVGRYLGEITLLDQQIGRVLTALDTLGLAANTLVIYSADHGDLCGSHGMIDKHYVMYEELIRVPLLMRWPDQIPAGQVTNAFISSALDLAATICAAADAPTPPSFAGQSLLPLCRRDRAPAAPWRERPDIFATYHGNQFGLYSQRMVRDERWKYIWNATAEDELYDTVNDPGELQNVATDPRWRSEGSRLRRRLLAWMEASDDRLLNLWTRQMLRR